jgi:hypothetical protein
MMMPILRAWFLRLRGMFRKEQLDRELEASISASSQVTPLP